MHVAYRLTGFSPSPNYPQMLVHVQEEEGQETLPEKFGTMFLNIQRWECLSGGGPSSNMFISLKIFWVMSVAMKQI